MATWEPELSILAPEPELSALQLPALPNTNHPTGSTLGLVTSMCPQESIAWGRAQASVL